jgi:hypothetical protein
LRHQCAVLAEAADDDPRPIKPMEDIAHQPLGNDELLTERGEENEGNGL